MIRIGAHLAGIERQLLNALDNANTAAALNALHISTGSRIQTPADDPAAFTQLASLRSELSSVTDTTSQIDAAATAVAEVQLVIEQVRTQINTIRSTLLTDEDGSLTSAERTTAQADIDAAIAQLGTLAGTEVHGRRVLDGSADYRVAGRDHTQVTAVEVYALTGSSQTISGSVTAAATQATLTYTGADGETTDAATFSLAGGRGTAVIEVVADESLSTVADRINAESHATGITAAADGDTLTFTTVDHGSEATLAVDVSSGTFDVAGGNGDGTAEGTDAQVTLDGVEVSASSISGNRVTYSRNGFHAVLELTAGFTGALSDMTVTDEGVLQFALSADINRPSKLALPGVQAARLGGTSGRLNDLASGGTLAGLGDNVSQAIRVVDEALAQFTLIEARADSFADVTVASSAALMEGMEDELTDAIDAIDAVNETEESLLLSQNQALATNAVSSLSLLQQQRISMVALLQNLAGLS